MSEKFNVIDGEKFKNAVSLWDNHCLRYVRQQSVSYEDIALTVTAVIIKCDCLGLFYEAKQGASTHQISCRYVALLGRCFLGYEIFCYDNERLQ